MRLLSLLREQAHLHGLLFCPGGLLGDMGAVFSPCRRYRYALWRRWGAGEYCLFIGLNPSTADETDDDPTTRRCKSFAAAWGYSAVCMANLFAWRATDPAEMRRASDPVGPANDAVLSAVHSQAGISIAAWGTHGHHLARGPTITREYQPLYHIGLTRGRCPRHPLYLPCGVLPEPLPAGQART